MVSLREHVRILVGVTIWQVPVLPAPLKREKTKEISQYSLPFSKVLEPLTPQDTGLFRAVGIFLNILPFWIAFLVQVTRTKSRPAQGYECDVLILILVIKRVFILFAFNDSGFGQYRGRDARRRIAQSTLLKL